MDRKMIAALVISGLLVFSGPVLAAEPVEGLPQSVISQWEIAEMAFSLANPVIEEEIVDPVDPADPADPADPVEGAEALEVEEGVLEDPAMDPAKALELAERHAFIGMAHLLGIPASRNIQDDPAWADIWSSVLEQVATGEVTMSEALASVETVDNALLGVSPGKGFVLGKTAMETTQAMTSATTRDKNDKTGAPSGNNGNQGDGNNDNGNGNN